jgi:hypothetical protein
MDTAATNSNHFASRAVDIVQDGAPSTACVAGDRSRFHITLLSRSDKMRHER